MTTRRALLCTLPVVCALLWWQAGSRAAAAPAADEAARVLMR